MAKGKFGGLFGGLNPLPDSDAILGLIQAAAARARRNPVQAANTQGMGYSASQNGGGRVSAPVSTLAGLPQGPVLDDLLKRGIIKEGMPTEQALAILNLAQLSAGVGVDVKALMDQIKANYEGFSGDILSAGQNFMQQIMGANFDPNDPNAALWQNDPTLSSYAGGLAQMDELSDMNLTTDLAWFQKMEAAQQAYYDSMMAAVSSGQIPLGGSGGGGGGGGYGGGGRRRRGGGGDSDLDSGLWEETDTRLRQLEQQQARATSNISANYPGWAEAILAANESPEYAATVNPLLNLNQSPESFEGAGQEELDRLLAEIDASEQIAEGNEAWEAAAPTNLQILLQNVRNRTGYAGRDDPTTEEVENWNTIPQEWLDTQAQMVNTNPIIMDNQTQQLQAAQDRIFQMAYDPEMSPYSPEDIQRFAQISQQYFGAGQPALDAPTVNQSELNEMEVDALPPEMGGPVINPDEPAYEYIAPGDRPTLIATGQDAESFAAMGPNGEILPEIRQAAVNTGVTDEFRQADPEVQYAVVQALNDEGIAIPQMAWTLGVPVDFENGVWRDVAGNPLGMSASEDSPITWDERMRPPWMTEEEPAPEEAGRSFSIGGMFAGIPFVGDRMGQTINEYGQELMRRAPHYRPDILAALQNLSVQQMQADMADQGGPEFFDPEPGKYWNPTPTPEEEISEMERAFMYITQAMQESRGKNTNFVPAPYRDTLVDTGTETTSLTNTTDANSPNYVVDDLVGVGDPEDANPQDYDVIMGDSMGYAGQSIPWQAIAQRRLNRTRITGKSQKSFNTGGQQYRPKSPRPKSLQTNISSYRPKTYKKKSGKGKW
jgi:hypothetical protein